LQAQFELRARFADGLGRDLKPLRQFAEHPFEVGLHEYRHRKSGAAFGPRQGDVFGRFGAVEVGKPGFGAVGVVDEVAVVVQLTGAEREAAVERAARDRGDDLALAAHGQGHLADAVVVELFQFGGGDDDPGRARAAAQGPDLLRSVLDPEPCGRCGRDACLPILIGVDFDREGLSGSDGRGDRFGEVGAGSLDLLVRIGTRSGRQTCSREQ